MGGEAGLEVGQQLGGVADLAWGELVVEAVGGEGSGGFADVPFDGVETVAAVGDVRDAEIFAGGEEVLHTFGDQGA